MKLHFSRLRRSLRNLLARGIRSMPRFRGKGRLGAAIGRLFSPQDSFADSIATFRMRDGSVMRADLRNRTEAWVFWTGEYDNDVIDRIASCLGDGSVVLDIGANVGFYTVALGQRVRESGGRIYAFEPIPANFSRLTEVVCLNDLEGTVFPCNVALGDEEGAIRLHLDDDYGSSTGNGIIIKGAVPVAAANAVSRITRLDTFAAENRITRCDLIKIDVEGAELMVLQGGAEFLRRCKPIIYGEFSAICMGLFGHSFLDVVSLVEPWGYCFYRQVGRKSFVKIEEVCEGIENVLLIPTRITESTIQAMGVAGNR